jgi:hypothetical protein
LPGKGSLKTSPGDPSIKQIEQIALKDVEAIKETLIARVARFCCFKGWFN